MWVFTLPMRNGNIILILSSSYLRSWFLPYLWGMETWLGSVYTRGVEEFLPYLWGMETSLSVYLRNLVYGFYLTYEEWKLGSTIAKTASKPKFLPYLWGMETCSRNRKRGRGWGFYLTYEEWKQWGTLREYLFKC